jgi:hypothetical protein
MGFRKIASLPLTLVFLVAPMVRGQKTADLILLDGKVWTEVPSQPQAEAVAIRADHVLAVGSSAAML